MNLDVAKFFLAAVSLLVCLGMSEWVARAFVEPAMFRRDPQVRYEPHPARAFTLKPCQEEVFTYSAQVRVDCDGFRLHSSEPKLDTLDEFRVLALGDSFTFGLGVEESDNWPAGVSFQLDPLTRILGPLTIASWLRS